MWQASGEELVDELRKALDAEPLPLLKQAESYRAREPEPRQREAAKRALDATTDAIGKAVATDLPSRLDEQPAATTVPTLPTPTERISTRTLDVAFRGQRWQITVELSEDPEGDWIILADNTVTDGTVDPRLLVSR